MNAMSQVRAIDMVDSGDGVDTMKFISFLAGIGSTMLEADFEWISTSISLNQQYLKCVEDFATDKEKSILVVQISNRSDIEEARVLILTTEIGSWNGSEGDSAVALVKNHPTLSSSQPLMAQIQIISLGSMPLVDVLHSFVQRSLKPVMESCWSTSSQQLELASRNQELSGANLVRKKVTELEQALSSCRQSAAIPEVNLLEHVREEVRTLLLQLSESGGAEREEAKEELLSRAKANEALKSSLCSSILTWNKELHELRTRYDKRLTTEATPDAEREFWMRLEKVLLHAEEQMRMPAVELTLELVRKLKIRAYIPTQFEEDAAAIRDRLKSVQNFKILMEKLPVGEVAASSEIPSLGAAVSRFFDHVRKTLPRSRYPIQRAVQLLEALSRELADRLVALLRRRKLMQLRFDEFSRICGFPDDKALAQRRQVPSAADAGSCHELFELWDTKEREFMADTAKARKFQLDAHAAESDVLHAPHRDVVDRLQLLYRFRRGHEDLRSVIEKVARSFHTAPGGGLDAAGAHQSALQILGEAYDRVDGVDVLDVSREGQEAWAAAAARYAEVVDRVEAQAAAQLRGSLEAAQGAGQMFRIFSAFSPLLTRPKVRAAIQEHQSKLLVQVQEDVRALQDRFKRKYAGSEAARLAGARDLPPVAGSILWARQVERQLDTYMRRVQDVLGEGWREHPDGRMLHEEGEAFRDKLDGSARFRKWQDEVLRAGRDAMDGCGAEAFATAPFRVVEARGREPVLAVNFDARQADVFREVRSLGLLGYRVIPSVEAYAAELRRIHPVATAVAGALQTYFQAAARVTPAVELLVAGPRRRMHSLIRLGLDPRRPGAAAAARELCRELHKEFERALPGRGAQFLDDFVRRREFHQLEVYARRLADCALHYQERVDAALAKCASVDAAVASLRTCPLEPAGLRTALEEVQRLVAELELAAFSNLAEWVAGADARVADALADRLEEAVRLWTACLRQDVADGDASAGGGVRALVEAARTRHEIKMRGSALLLDPPLEMARLRCVESLGAALAVVTELPRLRHSAYAEFLGEEPADDRLPADYTAVAARVPAAVLREAYAAVDGLLADCQGFVDGWLAYQALWDTEPADALARVGEDVGQGLELLAQLRASRALFDGMEARRRFGPVTVDLSAAQGGVAAKFAAWQAELTTGFAALVGARTRELHGALRAARERVEAHSAHSGTSDAVAFLTSMEALRGEREGWSALLRALQAGERALKRDHRTVFRDRLAAGWFDVANAENEWAAFEHIYGRREAELREQVPLLQERILKEEAAVAERTRDLVGADWRDNKPVGAELAPAAALERVRVFEAKVAALLPAFKAQCAAEADEVRALGGLFVLGTERHDSRRIDNQLRGRSGRQGDPGESRFFLSLEDDLMAQFSTGAVSWVMDRAMPEDVPIEAKMVSKAIERAQGTVEGRNAESRKETLKYDEVMNEQRKVIYGRRHQIIDGDDMHSETLEMIEDVITDAVDAQLNGEFAEAWDLRALYNELQTYYPTSFTVESLATFTDRDSLVSAVIADALATYEAKCAAFPEGIETAKVIERDVLLQVVDTRWREHLSDMDYLKDGIHLRQVAQIDPLTAWQKEGFELFGAMLEAINRDYVRFITHVVVTVTEEIESDAANALEGAVTNAPAVEADVVTTMAGGTTVAATTPNEKLGRNDPCWCGSGKKFKQCHGRP